MLYKCKDTFRLWNKIGTCPNIEAEIDVTDKSQFFVRPHHVKGKDKNILDKEMKRLCYVGILKDSYKR